MNTRFGLSLLLSAAALSACATSPDGDDDDFDGTTVDDVTSPRVVGTWDGTSAFAFAGICQNVYARSLTSAGYTRAAGSVLTDTCGFQCVELAVRYFNYRKGIPASSWHVGTASQMCNTHPSGVVATSTPAPGDLVVLKANDPAVGTGPAGHVAVVRSATSTSVATFNQNWAHDSTAFANVPRKDVACFLHKR